MNVIQDHIGRRWNQAAAFTQDAFAKAKQVGGRSIVQLNQTKTDLTAKAQHLWTTTIKQELWQNKLKPNLKENIFTRFYGNNPEVFCWQNTAILTTGAAIPFLIGVGVVALIGIEILPIVTLGGALVFVGSNVLAQKRIEKQYFTEQAWPRLNDLRQAVSQMSFNHTSLDAVNIAHGELKSTKTPKLFFMKKEIKSLKEPIEKYKEKFREIETRRDAHDQNRLEELKQDLIKKIEAIMQAHDKNRPLDALIPPVGVPNQPAPVPNQPPQDNEIVVQEQEQE